MPILKDLLESNDIDKIDKDEIDKVCDGMYTPEEVQDGLNKLEELGVLSSKVSPATKEKEYGIKKPEEPKLLPILKDLIKDAKKDKIKKDDIKKACDGVMDND